MSYGIDYGFGSTNRDPETGIRYGVIPQNDVLQAWVDSSEGDYGEPHCPKCGNEAVAIDAEGVPDFDDMGDDWDAEGCEYACLMCKHTFDHDQAFGDEPLAFTLDDGEYQATQDGDDCDIFILKSPYYTRAQYCSPCAPGACYLREPVDENGPKAYCFPPDWFDWYSESGEEPAGEYNGQKTSCPYLVWRVDNDELVYRPCGNA